MICFWLGMMISATKYASCGFSIMVTLRGAPPKPADQRADSHLHIRVTAKQKAGWVKQAQKDGKKLSEWVVARLEA
jgi:hypothetical protein